jgi:hypothetical protein
MLQRRFILALARGAGPAEAARALGMSRQSAYRLRARPGAEGFSAAWEEAQAFARQAAAAARSPGAGLGIDTILVPRFYRGRLIGFVQREDMSHAMRVLARLDRLAEGLGNTSSGLPSAEGLEAFRRLTGRQK